MDEHTDHQLWQYIFAEEWPSPELLQEMMAQGEAIVPSLIEFLGEIQNPEVTITSICLAALMLGHMQAVSAIPKLLALYYEYDEDYLEDITRALVLMGPPALEPMLSAVQDERLGWYPRAMLAEGARDSACAVPDRGLRARVTAVMRDVLARYVSNPDALSDDQVQVLGSLIADLADLRDPLARPLIDQAFTDDLVDEAIVDAAYVADIYAGRAPASSLHSGSWMRSYTARYEAHRRTLEQGRARAIAGGLGRNDPCWCGSGRKYKHCHRQEDQRHR